MLPSSHVLTISAGDYCANEGKNLGDYEMVGVHSVEIVNDILHQRIPHKFNLSIPSDAEVVVAYHSNSSLIGRFGTPKDEKKNIEYFTDSHGTALIPKRRL